MPNEILSKSLTGIAGEYFVAAELSRRGYMASITLRNNDSIDIHASDLANDKLLAIQVKTNQYGNRSWPLNKKVEQIIDPKLFFIFVSLREYNQRPEYFIVPGIALAKIIREDHQNWLTTPGRNGIKHKDNDLRRFIDPKGKFLERWDLLK